MKRTLLLTLVVLSVASLAFAQEPGGHIGIYIDPGYANCNLTDYTLYQNVDVYFVHTDAVEANTSQWKAELSPEWTNYASPGAADFGSNLILGGIDSGVVVTYVGCKALPYLLATWPQFMFGDPPACTLAMSIVADPNNVNPQIEAVDCDSNILLASGGVLRANGDETCPCDTPATKDSSWSKIKALYR